MWAKAHATRTFVGRVFERFHELMRQPHERKVDSRSLPSIIDAFLDWVQKHRSPATFEWDRYRLQRTAERYPEFRVGDLKPFSRWPHDG